MGVLLCIGSAGFIHRFYFILVYFKDIFGKELEFGAGVEAEVRRAGSDTELEQHSGGTPWLALAVNLTLLFLKADFAP